MPSLQPQLESFVYYSAKVNSFDEQEWNKEGLPVLWQTSKLSMERVLEKVGLDLDFEEQWRRGNRER